MSCQCCTQPPVPRVVQLGEDDGGASILGEDPLSDPSAAISSFAGIGLDKTGFVTNGDGTSSYQNASTGATVAFNSKFISGDDGWSGDNSWVKQRGQRQFFFHPTFSCHFVIEFDENLYEIDIAESESSDNPAPGSLLSTTARSFTWAPSAVDGFCVPAGFDDALAASDFAVNGAQGLIDPDSLTIWPSSDVFVFAVPGVNEMVRLENVRWSCVDGYTPPADGSANGWPPGPNALS